MSQNGSTVRPDPVTLEIVRNLLIAILDEGEINLSRTAFSPIIYEVKDYCVGLLDVHGNTIAQSRGGIPTFMADLGEPVKDGIRIYGEQGFAPGDIVLINAAVVCGQHLNNMVLYMPVHWEGQVVGFAAVRAHWTDVGGSVPGSMATDTKDIFQEGLQLRTVKIHKAGVLDEELMRVISHNIRFPELSLGDMAAQIAACTLIAKRWHEMIAKYGWPMMQACIETIWDQSEAFVRRQIAALPDGRYEADAFMDDDGIDFSKTLPVKVGVTIAGDSLEIDFSEVAKQTQGPMNSGRSGGLAAARVAFKSAILPSLPPNEGAFRPLSVKLPEGTLLSATDNAAMGMWNLALKTVIDVIYRALESGSAGSRAGWPSWLAGYVPVLRDGPGDGETILCPRHCAGWVGCRAGRRRFFAAEDDDAWRYPQCASRSGGNRLPAVDRTLGLAYRQRRRRRIPRWARPVQDLPRASGCRGHSGLRTIEMSAVGPVRWRIGAGRLCPRHPARRDGAHAVSEGDRAEAEIRRDCRDAVGRRGWPRQPLPAGHRGGA